MILYDKIISDNFYWHNITESCKNFIKECTLCTSKNKSTILLPSINQIICEYPRELYVIDITTIPNEYTENEESQLYLLSIIDHFSKYAYNYIIKKKDQKTVLEKIKIL